MIPDSERFSCFFLRLVRQKGNWTRNLDKLSTGSADLTVFLRAITPNRVRPPTRGMSVSARSLNQH
jgi:hypothetical protein